MTFSTVLVTGASAGLGFALVTVGLAQGYNVVACSRAPESINVEHSNLLKLKVNVADVNSVESAFKSAQRHFGNIGIVINNAGYGLVGEFESYTIEEMHRQMNVNFWGVTYVTKEALNYMRESGKGGRILQISSVAGYYPSPCLSMYNASKFAVEGLSQTIMRELDESWNIAITIVQPGGMQTEWAASNMQWSKPHPAYENDKSWRPIWENYHGSEETDPIKAANLLYTIARLDKPPQKLVLGHDSLELIRKQHQDIGQELEKNVALSTSVARDNFDPGSVKILRENLQSM
ncbi:short chain dehydrogenase [Schizosaccharomyces cryophilus OY26]|uniref:Short chain dehydrogenase n=1 Tax=Schizosaccharomyces cryophilus (strain OY26 / ATCC MYA-4695 / CBS 11777 / NBRC 106824 / NRRL Y48691) TaxID=653667 RepID=S9XEK6_SCHCR|nr:short chain dehydrogenase [Schizosaccharomyces cryophilus OY26]EPY52226.1 short chain dehydrogenase [Schizosaccharomyces cryophilus OY26]